jgi:uncharacterized protein
MAVTYLRHDLSATLGNLARSWESCSITELDCADESEVLDFLAVRPIHTVYLTTLIRDNGLVSPNNRGSFYACRNGLGDLEGVALLGHATLIETRNETALAQFAGLARNCQSAHLIRGERNTLNRFWTHYGAASEPRQVARELLLEKTTEDTSEKPVEGLRLAMADDLERVATVNSAMAFEEAGISPLQKDPTGFRYRIARRIEQGRVWVWFHDHQMVFKADLIGDTPEVTYLEGIYVHPDVRSKGYGLRCLKQLSSILLGRNQSICLTVNHRNKAAYALYTRAGFKFHSFYKTIYLR